MAAMNIAITKQDLHVKLFVGGSSLSSSCLKFSANTILKYLHHHAVLQSFQQGPITEDI